MYLYSTLYATHNSQFHTTNTGFSRILNTNTLLYFNFHQTLWRFVALSLQLASFVFIAFFSLFLFHHFCSLSIDSPSSRWIFPSKASIKCFVFYRFDKLFYLQLTSRNEGFALLPKVFIQTVCEWNTQCWHKHGMRYFKFMLRNLTVSFSIEIYSFNGNIILYCGNAEGQIAIQEENWYLK